MVVSEPSALANTLLRRWLLECRGNESLAGRGLARVSRHSGDIVVECRKRGGYGSPASQT